MSNTMLLYKNVAPVNKERHAKWGVTGTERFDFAKNTNSVPLSAVEFPAASKEYSIVFAKSKEGMMPIAILGVRTGENVFVDEEGAWNGRYIPAFIRRYPFVFSTGDEGKTLTLCLDEGYPGCNEGGEGERLFTDDGVNSPYLEKVIAFLREYQENFQRTQVFCKRLEELELLEPMGAQFKTPDGKDGSLGGFYVVSREKLKQIPQEKIAEMVKSDELEMIYLHLNSMRNLRETIKRLS